MTGENTQCCSEMHSYLDAGEDSDAIACLNAHCPLPFSKDLNNQQSAITRVSQVDGSCGKRACPWRDIVDRLRLRVHSHTPLAGVDDPDGCDRALELDGIMDVACLTTRVVRSLSPKHNRTEEERGIHAGDFTWTAKNGIVIKGQLQGLSHIGTIRAWRNIEKDEFGHPELLKKGFGPCNAQGFLEGRLYGRVVSAASGGYANSRVVGIYRFYFDPNYFAAKTKTTGVSGLIEGLVIKPCSR